MCHLVLQQDLKDRKRQQYQVLAQLRDKRHQSARARRYYEEYQVRMRSKMLKKRTKEELVSECMAGVELELALGVIAFGRGHFVACVLIQNLNSG